MKQIILPADNLSYNIIYVQWPGYTERYGNKVLNWIDKHGKDWPRNFYLLERAFDLPMRLEKLPEVTKKELVWVITSFYDPDLKDWQSVFRDSPLSIVTPDYFHIERVSKTLLPFM